MPRVEHFGLVNLRTGELFTAEITPVARRLVRGKWMRLFLDSKEALMRRSPGVHGQSYRVLAYVECKSKWDNEIPSATETAINLGIAPSAAFRAYRELVEAEFILKRGTRYYLSPFVGWKGTQRAFDTACREFFGTDPLPRLLPALPSGKS